MTTTQNTPQTEVPRADTAPDAAPTQVTEKQARQVAEAARETTWRKPSFGKGLFGGRLKLNLVHPWPTPDPAATARAEPFLAKLRDYAVAHVDGRQIERDAFIPDEVFRGLARLGAFGMKIGRAHV